LEDGHLIELVRQLSETPVAQTERDQRIAQLTDELAQKSHLLEQAAEEKKRAGLELGELQAKLDQVEANAAEEKKRAGLELRELQARLGQVEANAAEEKKRAELQLRELQARLVPPGVSSGSEAAPSYPRLEGGTYYITNYETKECICLDNKSSPIYMRGQTGNDKERVGEP
jgi:septal ring factor EnvC (AmiA/AmiB activator)